MGLDEEEDEGEDEGEGEEEEEQCRCKRFPIFQTDQTYICVFFFLFVFLAAQVSPGVSPEQ